MFWMYQSWPAVLTASSCCQSMLVSLTMSVEDRREIFLVIRLAKSTRPGLEDGGPDSNSSFGR